MTMTKLNSAPPAAIVRRVDSAPLKDAGSSTSVTAPDVDGYTFVLWVAFHMSIGFGVWLGNAPESRTTLVYPVTQTGQNTAPSGKYIQAYALYVRNS